MRRKWRLLTALVIASIAAGCATEPQAPSRPATEGIDEILQAAVERGDVAGVVAAAATLDGLFYRAAFGKRDVAADAEMTPETIFRIASMTKAVTSVAVMQLVEQARVDLDEPAGTYLAELVNRKVLTGIDEHGKAVLRPAASPVTVRQLLSHSSGFAYELWNESILTLVEKGGLANGRLR